MMKRVTLELRDDLYNRLYAAAAARGAPVSELLRQAVVLVLAAIKLQDDPDAQLVLRYGDSEREVIIL